MLDLDKHFKELLKSTLNKLNLVTREEFDVQTRVLAKTREKLEALKKQVEELENRES